MKQKIITLSCIALCLVVFVSAIYEGPQASERARPPALEAQPVVSISHTVTTTPEPEVIAHPFTDEEVVMLAKTIWAEARGVPSVARQAAVGWCALNRLDNGAFGSTLAEVLSTPKQFAYYEESPVTPELLALAEDVLTRWYAEHLGDTDAGRTLPSDYLYFEGDGKENHFRKTWIGTGEEWDWSLQSPYEEAHE